MDNIEKNINIISTRDILATHGIRLSKSKGQNFLIDGNIPEKIVKISGIDKTCGVLEIGPGLGALTQVLYRVAGHVTAVELDIKLASILQDMFNAQNNVDIIQGNALTLDIKQLTTDKRPELTFHVCANLPYNITTPIITTLIESEVFKSLTLMVQKEVAERICAKPDSPAYGAFTVYANYYTKPEILFDVPPECFTPRPKVMSSVIKMEIRAESLLDEHDEKTFFKVVRAAFGQRRKTLVNALHSVYGNAHSKEAISEYVASCGLDIKVRGEVLNIEDFIKLSRYFIE